MKLRLSSLSRFVARPTWKRFWTDVQVVAAPDASFTAGKLDFGGLRSGEAWLVSFWAKHNSHKCSKDHHHSLKPLHSCRTFRCSAEQSRGSRFVCVLVAVCLTNPSAAMRRR